MSRIEMKDLGEPHTYPSTAPPPYSVLPPSYGPTVVQPGPVIHPANTTVIHSPGVMMSPDASMVICSSCNRQIVTRVEYKPSACTHLFAITLCVLTLWPCVFIPYCIPSCNKAQHYCPNCNAYIGSDRS